MKRYTNSIVVLLAVVVLALGGTLAARTFMAGADAPTDTPEHKSAEEIVAACSDGRRDALSKESCYSKAFQDLTRAVGPVRAFETLFTVQTIDRDALGCHFIGHGIGYGTYERSPETWREDFRTINTACTYGAMHGILEMAVADLPDGLTAENIPRICGTQPPGDCNHIVGHLALLETAGDIPAALRLCNSLSSKPAQEAFCDTGVFMENITAVNLVEHGYADQSYLDWAGRLPEIIQLCQSQSDAGAHEACWKEAAHAIDTAYADDAAAVFNQCERARGASARRECKVHAIGIMAAGTNFQLDDARSMCELAQHTNAFRRTCYLQLVASALATSKDHASEVIDYCTTLTTEAGRACMKMTHTILAGTHGLSPRAFADLCNAAPAAMRAACLNGGALNFSPHEVHEED